MLSASERNQLIEKMRQLPTQLEAAVSGLDDQQLDTPYGEGKWTPRQVVHHLADSHMNGFIRAKLILTEENPELKPYDQEQFARTQEVKSVSLAASLQILRGVQERWAALLAAQPESAWGRRARHPEVADYGLERLLTIYGNHGAKHVEHIMGLRRRMGW